MPNVCLFLPIDPASLGGVRCGCVLMGKTQITWDLAANVSRLQCVGPSGSTGLTRGRLVGDRVCDAIANLVADDGRPPRKMVAARRWALGALAAGSGGNGQPDVRQALLAQALCKGRQNTHLMMQVCQPTAFSASARQKACFQQLRLAGNCLSAASCEAYR